MNITFMIRRTLSQKECVLLAVVLILSSITRIGCIDDDDDEDPDPQPGAEIPTGPRSPAPIKDLRTLPMDFQMNED